MRNPEMELGECRYIGREDLHVYCRGRRIDGVFTPAEREYKLWTADSVGSVWDAAGWTDWPSVGRQIEKLLKEAPRP